MSYFTADQKKKLLEVLAPSSVNRYQTWLKRIQGDKFNIADFEKNKQQYVRIVLGLKDKTQTLASIVKVMTIFSKNKDAIKYYQDEFDKVKYNPNYEMERIRQEQSNKLTVEDVFEIKRDTINEWSAIPKRDLLKLSSLSLAIKYILVNLYTEIPPLRGQDYFNTMIVNKNKFDYDTFKNNKQNVLVLDDAKLYIFQGKRTNENNIRVLDLPSPVMVGVSYLVKILTKNKIQPLWLIPKIKTPTEHMDTNAFSKFIGRIFGMNISTTYLRNLFVSHYIDNGYTHEQLNNIASIMAHTRSTQVLVYGKNSKRLNPQLGDTPDIVQLKKEKEELEKRVAELETTIGRGRGRPKN